MPGMNGFENHSSDQGLERFGRLVPDYFLTTKIDDDSYAGEVNNYA